MRKISVLLPLLSLIFLISCSKGDNEVKEVKKYTIQQFYKNIQIGGGSWATDEKKLLVHSNQTGIYNLYELDVVTGEKKQISDSKIESFFALDYVPGTNMILYSADQGGNEIDQIYLIKEDGSVTNLTPFEGKKSDFAGWSLDKKNMFYLSNKRDDRFFDLYKMSVADWKSQIVYENTNGLQVTGLSWNERYVALSMPITTSENKLFLFDKEKNNTIEISDSANPGVYNASGFDKAGKHFYYLTDVGKEFTYLVEYDLATGKSRSKYETNWDVMYSYLSENEKYRVIAINEDGKNALKIFENSTWKQIEFPQVPDGDILAVNISPSEKLMRLTIGTSRAPSNIYVYNFESKELKKLTESLNPEIDPNDLVTAEVVRYKSFDGLEIPAIYYKPWNASDDNKVPALVWVHGGPGGQSRVGYFSLIQYLVNNGYAVLAVNNRGSSGYGKTFFKMDDKKHGDVDLKDCIYGKKWLQTREYIDPEKIGIIGGSYGGYMTMAAMAFTPDEFSVGVNIFGVTNWLRTLQSIPPYWESFRKALYEELGDPNTEDSVRLYNISPLFHADKIKNPVIVLQGANDPRVLKVESDEIVEKMKENNIPVEYVVFNDEGHGFVKKENEIKGYGDILKFLDKYLKKTEEIKS